MAEVQIGIVTGSEVKLNRDSEDKSLLLQCEISQEADMQTVELYRQAGEDYNPPEGSTVVILEAGKSWKLAIACDDGIESNVEQGERRVYSSDGGVIKANTYYKKDGTQEINGNADNAVAFTDLKTAFDTLKTEITTNLTAIATAIAGLGGAYTVIPLTASVDAAKIDSIKVP